MTTDDETPEQVRVCVRIPTFDSGQLFQTTEEMYSVLNAMQLVEPVIHNGLGFSENFERSLACVVDADNVRDYGDPIAALQGFVGALNAGIYPPPVILEFLRDGIEKYLEAGGSKTLDEIFGLAPAGPGKSHALKVKRMQDRDSFNNTIVHILHQYFEIPIWDAAHMVSDRGAAANHGESPVSGGRLDEQYRKKWKDELGQKPINYYFDFSSQQRSLEFLESFPIDRIGIRSKRRVEELKEQLREQIAISSRG